MDIREILALEPSTASIKKIDNFLSNLTPNHRDYPRALAHLAYLTFTLGDVSGAFTILFNYLEICIDKEKPTIYNTLIKIYYLQKDYDIKVVGFNGISQVLSQFDFITSINADDDNIPVFTESGKISVKMQSSWFAKNSGELSITPYTPVVFCAVSAVIALIA